eukprot:gene6690-13554_t
MAEDESSNSERKRWEKVTVSDLALRLVNDDQVLQEIKGRKVILLMGTTNAGKTTTLCYLSKKQLQLTFEKELMENGEFMSGFEEVIETTERFENFKIGHSNESTTKSIQLCSLPDCDILLADSCGFDDSEGILVDISNAVILRNAMLSCEVVYPVLVIDVRNLTTDKASAFTKLLRLVSRFFSPIADVIQNISFLFTHCPQNFTEANIKFYISKLMKADYIRQNPDMKIITEYILNYVGRHGSRTILFSADMTGDDCEESRQAVLNLIQSAPPITDFTTLGHPLSSEAQIGIHEKCQECRISIMHFLERSQYRKVQTEIDTLKSLHENIGLPSVTEQYEMAFNGIVSHLKDLIHTSDDNIINESYSNLNGNLKKINDSKALQDYFDVTTEFNRLLKALDVVVKDICYKIHSTPDTTSDSLLAMDQMSAIHQDVSKFISFDAKNSYTMLKNEIEERARGCNDNCASVIKNLQSVIKKATKESYDVIEWYLSQCQQMFKSLSHLRILKSFALHLSPQWIACYDDRLDAIISVLEDLRVEVFDENGLMSLIKRKECDDSTLSRLSFVHVIPLQIISTLCLHDDSFNSMRTNTVKHIQEIISEKLHTIYKDTIQLQSDLLQKDVVEVSDYTKVVDNTKLLQEASCFDNLLLLLLGTCDGNNNDHNNNDHNNNNNNNNIILSDWVANIITTVTSEWQHRLKALNAMIVTISLGVAVDGNNSGVTDTILPHTTSLQITSTFLRLDRMALPLEHLISTTAVTITSSTVNVRGDINTFVVAITNEIIKIIQFNNNENDNIENSNDIDVNGDKNDVYSIKLFLTNIISWMEFLPAIEKSVSLTSEDRMALLKFVPLLTSKKRDVITVISKLLKEIKHKAHEAILDRDCSIVRRNLDMLQEYKVLDEFISDDPKASVIYEECKSNLRYEISCMNTSANNYVSNGELDKANEIRRFFENSSVFASHFLEYDFNSMAQDLLGKHREAADKIYGEIELLLREDGTNNFDLIRDKLRNVMKGDGDTYWDPKNKSIYNQCDKILSDHFHKLDKKASDCEFEEDDEAGIESLYSLLQKCEGATALSGMTSYDPKNVLTTIFDICNTIYNRIESHIKRNLSKFKFRIASNQFNIIKKFNRMALFSVTTNHIQGNSADNYEETKIIMDFKERTEELLTNQILPLKDNLLNISREMLKYSSKSDIINNNDPMDFKEPNFDEIHHLLDNIVSADNSDQILFNDQIDFYEIKLEILNSIFEYSQHIDFTVRDLIYYENYKQASYLHEFMNSIRCIADKFVNPFKTSKIRKQCDIQAQNILLITKESIIIPKFAFTSHDIDKLSIHFTKLQHRNEFNSYNQSLTHLYTRVYHNEYKQFISNITSQPHLDHPDSNSSSTNNLSNAFEFIQCLWYCESQIECEDNNELQHLYSTSTNQFYTFFSHRLVNCKNQLQKRENIEIVEQDLLGMINITIQGLKSLDTCIKLIQDTKCITSSGTSSSTSYWRNVLQNMVNRQQILKYYEGQCQLQVEDNSKINELHVLEKNIESFNIFDEQNMEDIFSKLDYLYNYSIKKQSQSALIYLGNDIGNYVVNGDIDNGNDDSSNNGPDEIVQNIKKQLHECIDKVRSLLIDKDYSALAVGLHNIQQLEKSTVLQSICIDISKEIFIIVQAVNTQLLQTFTNAFEHNGPHDLDEIILEAEAWDKAFKSYHLSHVFESLMDKVKAEIAREIDDSIEIDKGRAVTVEDHASILVDIKAYVEDISNKDIQQLADNRIGRYIETLSIDHMDLFALRTALANLGSLGILISEEQSQFKAILTNMCGDQIYSQLIYPVSEAIQPTHLIFCLDESDSMKYYSSHLVTACKNFLKFRIQNGATNDIVTVIRFATTSRVTVTRQPILSITDNLSLHHITGGSGTCFLPALTIANQIISEGINKMDIIMIFLTGSKPNDRKTSIAYCNHFQKYFFLNKFQFFGIALNTIDDTLRQMPNGSFVTARSAIELKKKIQIIAHEATAKQSRQLAKGI